MTSTGGNQWQHAFFVLDSAGKFVEGVVAFAERIVLVTIRRTRMYLIKSKNDHHKAYTRHLENGKVVYIPAKGVTSAPSNIGLGRTGDKPHGKLVWSGRNTDMEDYPISSPLEKAAATTGQSARPSSRTDHGPRTKVLPKPALDALEDQTYFMSKKIPLQNDAIKIKKAIPRLFLLRKAARTLDGKIDFNGLQISIETGRSRSRAWKNPHDGTEGMSRMWLPYGYIKGTLGVDGDHLDCFVGPDRTAPNVYIITIRKAPDFTELDEQKCFLGVESAEEAQRVFHASYNDPRFFDSITMMPFEEFKEKAFSMKGQMIKSHVRAYTRHSASGAIVQVKEHDDSRRQEFEKMHVAYHLTANKPAIEKEGFRAGKAVGVGGETSHIYTSDDPKYLQGLADHLNTVQKILNHKQSTKQAVEYVGHNKQSMEVVRQIMNLYSKRLGRPLTENEEAAVIAFSGPMMKFSEIKPKFGKELSNFMRGNKHEVVRTRSRNAVRQSETMGGERAHKEGDVFLDDYKHFLKHHNNPDTPVGEFGTIPQEVATSAGIPAGPIRLMRGKQIDKHRGFGKEHIAVQHGKEIREAGYKSEEEFVQDVVKNFNAIYDVGKGRIALIADGKEGQKIHIIEARYSKGQKFYTIVTGYIANRPKFNEQKHKLLWKRILKALVSHLYILKKRRR